jgi:hypothetical protein
VRRPMKTEVHYLSPGTMRGEFSRYIGPGPGELRRGRESLNHIRFRLIFNLLWNFQLFLVY